MPEPYLTYGSPRYMLFSVPSIGGGDRPSSGSWRRDADLATYSVYISNPITVETEEN